ncbi:MAG TPA: hypothetical protein VFK05_14410 [Polyangiaceae bacterium]|nr:hypothetical protein [Polyangiaceae bacterium]
MAVRTRYFWLLAGTFVATASAATLACTGTAARASAPAHRPSARAEASAVLSALSPGPGSGSAPRDEQAPRLFPPLEGPAVSALGEDKDGSQRIVSYGLRELVRPDGSVELAGEYLPNARSVRALELPARLGGGFLFYVQSSSATLFFRARSFSAELEPFARLDFEAEQVIAGFDRLYVSARHPDRIVALSAEQGTAQNLGSLPASPSYSKMAFVDGWFGTLSVPLRGALVSFDAGVSWHPLGMAPTSIEIREGALRLSGADGVLDLDRTGTFTRRDAQDAAERDIPTNKLPSRGAASESPAHTRERRGRDALKLAVLRGFRAADGTLLVADSGELLRVRASDGKVLDSDSHAYPGSGECSALDYGANAGFVCNDGSNRTALYAFEPPLAMRRVRTFNGARYVAASGNGSLVIRGSCSGPGSEQPGSYCIARKSGEFSELRVRGDLGVERLVALADGRVAVIVPPRLGAAGFLSLIDVQGREQRIPLALPKSSTSALLEKGLWLDGFTELPASPTSPTSPASSASASPTAIKASASPSTQLAGWVVGSEPFAGVRVSLDGTVTMGRPENGIDRALLSANHALLVGRTGRTRETTDGGFEWTDVELPSEFDASRELRDEARLQGCSNVGCAFAGFVRVGFRSGNTAPRLRVANLPESTRLLQPGGSRWALRCEASGESSEPALAMSSRARASGGSSDEPTGALWAPFGELPPPALGPGEIGYDVGPADTESAGFRAYVWGERGADWARVGHLQLRLLDRFQLRRSVFQSAITRSPWPDALTAAEAFGFDTSGNPASWRAVTDATQRAAAVLASSRGLVDLLLFEEGKTVARIANAGRLGFNFGMLNSVAKLTDAWYLASFNENHSLVLAKISGGRTERVAEYPDPGHDLASATLVHGVRGEELGIWVMGRGWYLYPIDPVSHALQAPLFVSPAELAQMPPPCAGDTDGYLLVGAPSLEPNLRLPGGDGIAARRVEAQFIWSARGLCTRALAAESDGPHSGVAGTALAASAARVPLTLSDRRATGRRWGYVCAP